MKKRKFLPTLASVLFLALCWQLISTSIGYPSIFPGLPDLLKQVITLFLKADFYNHLLYTIIRGLAGSCITFIIAISLAIIASFSSFWRAFFHPILVLIRSIPIISLVLLALLWFSPENLPVFIAIVTMFPILYQNILSGFLRTDNRWVEMAQLFGKSKYECFFSIYLPASRQSIFDGLSTAMGFGWRAIIIGEVLAQPLHGIGSAMKHAQAFINVSELIAWTIIAVIISYFFEIQIRRLAKVKRRPNFSVKAVALNWTEELNPEKKEVNLSFVRKCFHEKTVLNGYSASFTSDAITCVKGYSGKGKTTLLRLISGLEKPDNGSVSYFHVHQLAYSFQDLRLLPWLTVWENILYISPKNEDKQQLAAYLLMRMDLLETLNRYPHELSGGQRQRVALARALTAQADVLLLDEPLTGLDNELKEKIILLLSDYIAAYRPVVVWATHEDIRLKNSKVVDLMI